MSSGLPLSLLSVGALALASQLPAGSFAFGHEGHWGSAGAGILLVAGAGKNRKVLVLLRSDDVTEPNLWNLAGGAVDWNEDPLEAGLRELGEETGLKFSPGVARDHVLGQTVWHSPNGLFRYTTSVVEAPASVMKRPIELNWENDAYRWVGEAWLRENELHPGFRAKMDELIALAFGSAASGNPPRELTGSTSRAGAGARRREVKVTSTMMLCPRCSGSGRVWVGTPNPDPRSSDTHYTTHSGWAACVCDNGQVPVQTPVQDSGSRSIAPAGSWVDLVSTPIRSVAAARRYLAQLHAFGFDYHPDERAANIVHAVESEDVRLFTDDEAALADARMDEVHRYLPDPSAVLLRLIVQTGGREAAVRNGIARGSRGTSGEAFTGIAVISATPHRVGFTGHAVVRNLSRGRPHDPRAIHHVEVTLGSDDLALLRDDRKVHRAAQQAAAGHGVSGPARIASGVYSAGSQAGPKYRVRVDVE